MLGVGGGCANRSSNISIEADDAATVKADIQKALDQKRQCAPLLRGIEPIALPADAGKGGGAKALLDVGLIEPTPGATAADVQLFRTTAKAAAWVVERRGVSTMIDLCYGRREVTSVEKLTPYPADTGPAVRYRYRIADAPDWASRPEVRAAFPFLDAALTQEFVSRDRVPVRNSHAVTSGLSDGLDLGKPPERFDL